MSSPAFAEAVTRRQVVRSIYFLISELGTLDSMGQCEDVHPFCSPSHQHL